MGPIIMVRFLAGVFLLSLAAVLWAQTTGSFFHPPARSKSSMPDPGAISQGVYRNSAFGFSYKLPFGWVDRTADMQDDSAEVPQSPGYCWPSSSGLRKQPATRSIPRS